MSIIIFILVGLFILSVLWFYLRGSKKDENRENENQVIEAFLNIENGDELHPHIESVRKWLVFYPKFSGMASYIQGLWTLSEFEKVRGMDRKIQIDILENIYFYNK
jgi:hypothetical protein